MVQPKDFLIPGTLVIGLVVQTAYFSNNYGMMSERLNTVANDVSILKARQQPNMNVYDEKMDEMRRELDRVRQEERDILSDLKKEVVFNESKNARTREQLLGKGLIR